jgi:hypothetical protein
MILFDLGVHRADVKGAGNRGGILLSSAAQIMFGVTREFLLATLAAESVVDIEVLITVCARGGDGHPADGVDHRSGSLWLVGFLHFMSRWRG